MKARLFLIAHGRSGDKGDACNIGVIARRPDWYRILDERVTAERVSDLFRPIAEGPVERYELPNLDALNFLIHNALGGGGSKSLRLDAQGKTYAQALLKMEIDLTENEWNEVRSHWGDRLPDL